MKSLKPYQEFLRYIAVMAVLLLLLWWMEFRFLIVQSNYEIYLAFLAVFFLLFGIWVATKINVQKAKTIIIEKEILIPETAFILNETERQQRNISQRELEVLTLMAQGMSNQEIADKLFVSLNTIKTHSTKLFEKLEVKRRTQAIETAKKLQLLPPTLV
ncbi:MAG: response regulator transcription factor [Flavobacterium sp.]|jgi:DNA-binding CsgD family transcriptional regulator